MLQWGKHYLSIIPVTAAFRRSRCNQSVYRKKGYDHAGESASQLLMFSTVFSVLIGVLVLIGNEGMLRLMFGKVESDVMQACITYLRISAYSYPALAVYNAGATLFRSMGKTSVTMYLSVASNLSVILDIGSCPANGRNRHCYGNGLRLGDPGGPFPLAAEVLTAFSLHASVSAFNLMQRLSITGYRVQFPIFLS